jgi:hypothetical protein
MGRQVKHLITLLITGLVVMCVHCGGRTTQADCSAQSKGSTYCGWETDDYKWVEVCCPPSHPYCGHRASNCPIGKCCNAPPLSLGLKPLSE